MKLTLNGISHRMTRVSLSKKQLDYFNKNNPNFQTIKSYDEEYEAGLSIQELKSKEQKST